MQLIEHSEAHIQIRPPRNIAAGETGNWSCADSASFTLDSQCSVDYVIGPGVSCFSLRFSIAVGVGFCDVASIECPLTLGLVPSNEADDTYVHIDDDNNAVLYSNTPEQRRKRHRDVTVDNCEPQVRCRWHKQSSVIFTIGCTPALFGGGGGGADIGPDE